MGHEAWLAVTCGACALAGWMGAALWSRRRRLPPASPRPRWPSTLQGRLREMPCAALLALLEMERKSGFLLLQRGKLLGQLRLRHGQVIAAGLRGDGPERRGVEVAYELLAWRDGRFDFVSAEIGGADEIGTSTTFLLMEGARRADEAEELLRPPGPMAGEAPRVEALVSGARAIERGE